MCTGKDYSVLEGDVQIDREDREPEDDLVDMDDHEHKPE